MVDNTVSLTAQNRTLSGWTDVRITRGIERCPSDFDIALTELSPIADDFTVQPGDPFQLKIGADLVITGYVDRFLPSFTATTHSVRILGRGKCEDLVDCSAEWPNSMIGNASVLSIAQKLAQPYGITVTGPAGGNSVPLFNFIITETPWSIIERVTRAAALLAYDGTDGNLILSQVGTVSAASGFTQGVNVLAAAGGRTMDQRYSTYQAFLQAFDQFGDLGDAGNLIKTVTDPNVTRHRLLTLIAENGPAGAALDLAKQRVTWEMVRRLGRSQFITLTCDSWRDSAGTLWTPNTLAPFDLPGLKIDPGTWLIDEVTFFMNDTEGTGAKIVLMPPQAFTPEPILLAPVYPDIAGAAATAPGP